MAQTVLVQPNGRIVVAGGDLSARAFRVARLRSNGNLDTTFGSTGKRGIAFGGEQECAFGATLQPDGKILLVGDSDFRVAVARLNANGSLDTTFSGDGRLIFSWGAMAAPRPCSCSRTARSWSAASRAPRAGTCRSRG